MEEDSDTDGTVENSDTISLSDGVTSYTTSDVFAGSGQVRLDFNVGPPNDITVAGSVTAPIDINVIIEAGSVFQTSSTGVIQTNSEGVIKTK